MIVGTGIDIVEIERVRAAAQRFGERFLKRVFTPGELAHCRSRRDPWPGLSARFAAKEAAMKALGAGMDAVGWRDLEVVSQPGGQPGLRLHGRALALARRRGVDSLWLSMSHSRTLAVAQVVAWAGGPSPTDPGLGEPGL